MKALQVINLCAREYNDPAFERIGRDADAPAVANGHNWLDLLNDGQRAICLVRPDANALTAAIQLAAGTKQAIPATASRLIDVTRNMGVAGATPGRTIRFGERGVEDMVDPDWHTADTSIVVKDVLYDDKKDPTIFWTVPPVPASPAVYIEVVLAATPDDVEDADADTDINLGDIYAVALQHWMLYRAYAMQVQSTITFERAKFFFAAFFNVLGVKIRADMFVAASAAGMFPPQAQGATASGRG
jgi:hypothetical protein